MQEEREKKGRERIANLQVIVTWSGSPVMQQLHMPPQQPLHSCVISPMHIPFSFALPSV